MEVDPPEPPCRRRLQTAHKLLRSKAAVVNVMVKRRDSPITSSKDERDECKRTADEASKGLDDTKTGVSPVSWEKHERYLLTIHAVSGVQAA
jgi:Mg2+ and Co2+ transporter CorA